MRLRLPTFLGFLAFLILAGTLTFGTPVAADPGDPPSGPVCGNNIKETGEECDGADLGGLQCSNFMLNGEGTMACTTSCTLDTSGCMIGSSSSTDSSASSVESVSSESSSSSSEGLSSSESSSSSEETSCTDELDAMIPADQLAQSGADLAIADATAVRAEYNTIDAAYADLQSKLDVYDASQTSINFAAFVSAYDSLDTHIKASQSGAYLSLLISDAGMLNEVDGFLSAYDAYRMCSGFSESTSSDSSDSSVSSSEASSASSAVSAAPPCDAERVAVEDARAQYTKAFDVEKKKLDAHTANLGEIRTSTKNIDGLLRIATWQVEHNTWYLSKQQIEAGLAAEKKKLADAKAKEAGLKQDWLTAKADATVKANALTAAVKAFEECKKGNTP